MSGEENIKKEEKEREGINNNTNPKNIKEEYKINENSEPLNSIINDLNKMNAFLQDSN